MVWLEWDIYMLQVQAELRPSGDRRFCQRDIDRCNKALKKLAENYSPGKAMEVYTIKPAKDQRKILSGLNIPPGTYIYMVRGENIPQSDVLKIATEQMLESVREWRALKGKGDIKDWEYVVRNTKYVGNWILAPEYQDRAQQGNNSSSSRSEFGWY